MAVKFNVIPFDIEATFQKEELDAKALITRTDKKELLYLLQKRIKI